MIAFRPAVRENTPLIIGIAGPTKSGKTMSALRLATGLANGGKIVMINAEGARGHQYADKFSYLACDLTPPYRYGVYEEVLREAAKLRPGAIIVDSMSHAHDGPGGFLEWHEEELDRIAGNDYAKRNQANFTAWIKPKQAENAFRYAMLEVQCPLILCFRAKEKMEIKTGRPPKDLGWQPIGGEGLMFETIFTLTLPPYSKGLPDLEVSAMREPFDTMVPKDKQIDEALGRELVKWAAGAATTSTPKKPEHPNADILADIQKALVDGEMSGSSSQDKETRAGVLQRAFATASWKAIEGLSAEQLRDGLAKLKRELKLDAPVTTSAPATGQPSFLEDPKEDVLAAIGMSMGVLMGQDRMWPPSETNRICMAIAGVDSDNLDKAEIAALKELDTVLRDTIAKKPETAKRVKDILPGRIA